MNLKREDILSKAKHDCYVEMYAKAQPPADYDNLLEEFHSGKIGKDERIYERHYLSMDEYTYIRNKYIKAYRMTNLWDENIELLEDYLKNGGTKDKYTEIIDEKGFVHPGYRGYEKVKPIKEQIYNYIQKYTNDATEAQNISDKITNIVMQTISDCKNFYNFDKEESYFIALGASPTCNPKIVKKWWKDNYDIDVEIEERNPLLFWLQDEYGDEFEQIMIDEYGENWKEFWDNCWKKEKEEKAKEKEEIIKKLMVEQAENEPPID